MSSSGSNSLMAYREIDVGDVGQYLADDRWEMQQKLDGIRARLIIADGVASIVNAGGNPLVSSTAAPVVRKIEAFGNFYLTYFPHEELQIEGEILGENWYVFDLPICSMFHINHGAAWKLRRTSLVVLLTSFHEIPEFEFIRVVGTASTIVAKNNLWAYILENGGEGAIFKHITGIVTDGKRIDHIVKAKITHTVDCFVLEKGPGNGINGTGNWLRLGIIKDGAEFEIGRCSFIGKNYADVGDVVEVKYLYAGNGGRLVQPVMLKLRPDKTREQCGPEQLSFVCKAVFE